MDVIGTVQRSRQECLFKMKALHNLHRSSQFMGKFLDVSQGQESLAGEVLFHSAVISYAKPFTNTDTISGKKKLRDTEFRGHPGFDIELHDHLLKLRKTVIAHDDLTEIEPTFVWIQVQTGSPENPRSAPFQARLRNNCLSFPKYTESASKIQAHIEAALNRVVVLLHKEIVRLREIIVANPSSWTQATGTKPALLDFLIGDGITTSFKLDLSPVETHPLLDNKTPTPPKSLKSYHYSALDFHVAFNGRQKFGDGEEDFIEIRHGSAPP